MLGKGSSVANETVRINFGEKRKEHIMNLRLLTRNKEQIQLALTDTNKYFFWQKYGREGTTAEYILYFIEFGGGKTFAEHLKEKYDHDR